MTAGLDLSNKQANLKTQLTLFSKHQLESINMIKQGTPKPTSEWNQTIHNQNPIYFIKCFLEIKHHNSACRTSYHSQSKSPTFQTLHLTPNIYIYEASQFRFRSLSKTFKISKTPQILKLPTIETQNRHPNFQMEKKMTFIKRKRNYTPAHRNVSCLNSFLLDFLQISKNSMEKMMVGAAYQERNPRGSNGTSRACHVSGGRLKIV